MFPSSSPLSSDYLREHIRESIHDLKPFELVMRDVTGSENGYLFLNVKKGNDEIIEMHDQLYRGILKSILFREVTYIPHMTVGRLKNKQDFHNALIGAEKFHFEFSTIVNEITVEIIDQNQKSNLNFTVSLEG
ncbi:2'-5' RNA ligase family protein [Peribacillus deserti]